MVYIVWILLSQSQQLIMLRFYLSFATLVKSISGSVLGKQLILVFHTRSWCCIFVSKRYSKLVRISAVTTFQNLSCFTNDAEVRHTEKK